MSKLDSSERGKASVNKRQLWGAKTNYEKPLIYSFDPFMKRPIFGPKLPKSTRNTKYFLNTFVT